jgi:hypothetical protein
MGGDPKETPAKLRKLFRQHVHHIWGMLRSGRRNELSERDNDLAEILLEHEEHREHFENTDILDGGQYDAGAAFNPFLHISMHRMAADQLSANSPAETALFCEAMVGRGCTRHEAVHFVIMIMLHVLHVSATGGRAFDAARYQRLLIKCSKVDPADMDKVIAEDLSGQPHRQDLH